MFISYSARELHEEIQKNRLAYSHHYAPHSKPSVAFWFIDALQVETRQEVTNRRLRGERRVPVTRERPYYGPSCVASDGADIF